MGRAQRADAISENRAAAAGLANRPRSQETVRWSPIVSGRAENRGTPVEAWEIVQPEPACPPRGSRRAPAMGQRMAVGVELAPWRLDRPSKGLRWRNCGNGLPARRVTPTVERFDVALAVSRCPVGAMALSFVVAQKHKIPGGVPGIFGTADEKAACYSASLAGAALSWPYFSAPSFSNRSSCVSRKSMWPSSSARSSSKSFMET